MLPRKLLSAFDDTTFVKVFKLSFKSKDELAFAGIINFSKRP